MQFLKSKLRIVDQFRGMISYNSRARLVVSEHIVNVSAQILKEMAKIENTEIQEIFASSSFCLYLVFGVGDKTVEFTVNSEVVEVDLPYREALLRKHVCTCLEEVPGIVQSAMDFLRTFNEQTKRNKAR